MNFIIMRKTIVYVSFYSFLSICAAHGMDNKINNPINKIKSISDRYKDNMILAKFSSTSPITIIKPSQNLEITQETMYIITIRKRTTNKTLTPSLNTLAHLPNTTINTTTE
jgi:hypothetical protein